MVVEVAAKPMVVRGFDRRSDFIRFSFRPFSRLFLSLRVVNFSLPLGWCLLSSHQQRTTRVREIVEGKTEGNSTTFTKGRLFALELQWEWSRKSGRQGNAYAQKREH